jgi:hypothetical protein
MHVLMGEKEGRRTAAAILQGGKEAEKEGKEKLCGAPAMFSKKA